MSFTQILDAVQGSTDTQGQLDPANVGPAAPLSGEDQFVTAAEEIAKATAKAREEEKNKLYPELKRLKEEADAARAVNKEYEDRDALRAQEQAAKDAAEAARQQAEADSKLSDIDLLKQEVKRTQEALAEEKQARELSNALLVQEHKFSELQSYRSMVIEQNRESINPELIDFIGGNTAEEIDQSVSVLQGKTAAIMESVVSAAQAARQALPGVRVTNPAGPLDNQSAQQQFTPDYVHNMSAAEYAQKRHLINPGAVNSSRGQGLFSN